MTGKFKNPNDCITDVDNNDSSTSSTLPPLGTTSTTQPGTDEGGGEVGDEGFGLKVYEEGFGDVSVDGANNLTASVVLLAKLRNGGGGAYERWWKRGCHQKRRFGWRCRSDIRRDRQS